MHSELFLEALETGLLKESSAASNSLMRRLVLAGERGTAKSGLIDSMLARNMSKKEMLGMAELAGNKNMDKRILDKVLSATGRRSDVMNQAGGHGLSNLRAAIPAALGGADGALLAGNLAGKATALKSAFSIPALPGIAGIMSATPGVSAIPAIPGYTAAAIKGGLAASALPAFAAGGAAVGLGASKVLSNIVRNSRMKGLQKGVKSGFGLNKGDKALVDALKSEFRKVDPSALGVIRRHQGKAAIGAGAIGAGAATGAMKSSMKNSDMAMRDLLDGDT